MLSSVGHTPRLGTAGSHSNSVLGDTLVGFQEMQLCACDIRWREKDEQRPRGRIPKGQKGGRVARSLEFLGRAEGNNRHGPSFLVASGKAENYQTDLK